MQRIGGDESITHPRAPAGFVMPRPRNKEIYVGMRHGHLTVTRLVGRDKFGIAVYECQCECGGFVKMRTNHFYETRRYCTRKCMFLQKQRMPDLLGKKFTRWTVESFAGFGQRQRPLWNCVCECGNKSVVPSSTLATGGSLSCGCLNLERITKYFTPEAKLEATRRSARESGRRNAARVKAIKIKYESKKLRATPSWLTKADWDRMNALYALARKLTKETGILHVVDHIVPLNGKCVSGLHVPDNLQILTQSANAAKSNRYAELSGD